MNNPHQLGKQVVNHIFVSYIQNGFVNLRVACCLVKEKVKLGIENVNESLLAFSRLFGEILHVMKPCNMTGQGLSVEVRQGTAQRVPNEDHEFVNVGRKLVCEHVTWSMSEKLKFQ